VSYVSDRGNINGLLFKFYFRGPNPNDMCLTQRVRFFFAPTQARPHPHQTGAGTPSKFQRNRAKAIWEDRKRTC
jgi:hypothetical protein